MKKILHLVALALLTGLAACTNNFEEYARPKAGSDVIEPDYLFTRSLVTGSGLSVGVWQLVHQTGGSVYAQHFANIKPGFTSDNFEPGPGNSVWNWYYARSSFASLNLNHNVLKLTRELANPVQEACARIWNVYMYQLLTDMYGDIPYSADFESIKPPFDRQKDIYTDLLRELDEAIQQIDANKTKGYKTFAAADVLYKGDLDKWTKFANGLMMRIALRASKVAATELTQPYLAKVKLEQTMQTNADMALILPDPNGPTYHVKNPLAYVYGWHEVRMSQTMYQLLATNADPRLAVFAEPNAAGLFVGLPNGQKQEDLNLNYQSDYKPNYCNIGSFFTQPTTPHYLLTAAESWFLKAEAAQRGWMAGNAADYYHEGIRASMQQFGIDAAQIDAFLAGPAKFDPAKGLQQIYEQRWLALFPNGQEAWSVVRQSGYPQLSAPIEYYPGNADMPRRVPYPTDERLYNEQNYNQATQAMGGDSQYTRVWWDGGQ